MSVDFTPGKYSAELKFGLFPADTDTNSMSFHRLLPQLYGVLPPFFFSKNCMQRSTYDDLFFFKQLLKFLQEMLQERW